MFRQHHGIFNKYYKVKFVVVVVNKAFEEVSTKSHHAAYLYPPYNHFCIYIYRLHLHILMTYTF